ncbi:hypothetical protein HPB51_022226 [Rhipicephalus microplus]|uniref:Uncharacterized protein n=1 Tax=Rhipicephalus microplus TaxID=6941 RepID=A0A9J6E473_RHIMP|nr:hypothetical protein HPB51_022226 [Rhipicephalus microplus]
MPRSQNRVILRPGGGLNVQACSPHRIIAALTMAAQLTPSVTEEDIICPNSTQSIFVVTTPSATNAAAYSRVTEIILTDQRHPVMAYLSPAGITSRGVIRGVDTDFDDAALNHMLIQPRNSSLLGARHIQNVETVILIFNGFKVLNYVYCGQVIYRCTLYKRQIATCRTCGQVGHCQDVYPTRSTKHTARVTANVDIATSCFTWCAVVVRAVADESKSSSKHPPQQPARFLPRPPNPKDILHDHEILLTLTSLPGPTRWHAKCPALNASFGYPAIEDDWIDHLRSRDWALQHKAVQKAQKGAGKLRLPVLTWAKPPGLPP